MLGEQSVEGILPRMARNFHCKEGKREEHSAERTEVPPTYLRELPLLRKITECHT